MVDKTLLARDLQSLEGQVAASPVRSYGSMFMLDLGNLRKQPDDRREHGEWCLLFEQAKWAFHSGNKLIVSWADEPQRIDHIFRSLKLDRVTNASCVARKRGKLRVEFANGIVLLAEVNSDPELRTDDQWIFFTPAGRAWTAKYDEIELEHQ